jgi:Delta7-sterol 5-desaturase
VSSWLRGLSWIQAAGWFALENALVLAGAVLAGHALRSRADEDRPPPLTRGELGLAALVALVNVAVTLAGWELWRRGVIRVRAELGGRAVLDALILLTTMDLSMYVLHRLAHPPKLYGLLHETHHRYERSRPLTLFVMHPLEAAGFGALWLGLLCAYAPTWAGLTAYLVLNVVSGTIGHLGGRALPRFGWISGSDFHARHHRDPSRNMGFYTRIWDRLFGTLAEGTAGPGPSR